MSISPKKGQISIEVIYAVGVMLTIFLILTGITFNRQSQLSDTNEYLEKRNQCLKLADYITAIAIAGDGTSVGVYVRYDTEIFKNAGAVVVGEVGGAPNPDAVSASCNFAANLTASSLSLLSSLDTYTIKSINGEVDIQPAP